MKTFGVCFFLLLIYGDCYNCDIQIGPEPWETDNDISQLSQVKANEDIPPDIKITSIRKINKTDNSVSVQWFYKRILALLLRGGQIMKNDDGSVDIMLRMRFTEERWNLLEGYINKEAGFSEDMFRRSSSYIEEAIYKPTITEKIVLAWTEYIQYYLIQYKEYLTWSFLILAALGALLWTWQHLTHTHVYIFLFLILYSYEAFVSFKEAEKQEYQRFIASMKACKWWSLLWDCEISPPDPLIFLNHMNPLKIGIRLFTTFVTEPMIALSATFKTIVGGITDGLMYPFDKIFYGILIVFFNILLIFLLIMIVCNYILNIPFNISFFGLSLLVNQRNRICTSANDVPQPILDNGNRLSGATLDKVLDICTRAINTAPAQNASNSSDQRLQLLKPRNHSMIKRSASTGRLPNFDSTGVYPGHGRGNVTFRQICADGGGDAQ